MDIHPSVVIELEQETAYQLGRLHTDDARNTGNVVVKAETMRDIVKFIKEKSGRNWSGYVTPSPLI